jgi:non-heme chloroperoxidase
VIEFIFGYFWIVVLLFVAGLVLTALPPPKRQKPRDVFNFAALKLRRVETPAPPLDRYAARDGEELAYRLYDSTSDSVLIFLHGSSYHGGGYHALASAISGAGVAQVILPNLRGHYMSGQRRGDVDYIGQLEVDIVDLIEALARKGIAGSITLGGHSSGGGLVLRFAGGSHNVLVSRFLALAPVIPNTPAIRENSGGWTSFHVARLYGLMILNFFQIKEFNALPIIQFNKPAEFWDGTETLSYSHRLNASFLPRYRSAEDVKALDGKALVLVGADDQAINAHALRDIFNANAPNAKFTILPGVDHFGVFNDPVAIDSMIEWLRTPLAAKTKVKSTT